MKHEEKNRDAERRSRAQDDRTVRANIYTCRDSLGSREESATLMCVVSRDNLTM